MTDQAPAAEDLDYFRNYRAELRPDLYRLDEEISDLMTQLEEGKIEPGPWKEAFINLLGLGMASAILAGAGYGKRSIPRDDIGSIIRPALANQIRYLNGFYGSIIESEDFQRSWRSRARLYTSSIVAPFWQGYSYGLPLPAIPGDGTSQCGQNDRCSWEIEWIDEQAGDADAFWTLHPAEHCQTCIERARIWNPLQFRGGQMIDIPFFKEFETVKHILGRHNQKLHGNRGIAAARGSEHPQAPLSTGPYDRTIDDDVRTIMDRFGKTRSVTQARSDYAKAYLQWKLSRKYLERPDPKAFGSDVPRAANHIRRLVDSHIAGQLGTGKPKPPAKTPAKTVDLESVQAGVRETRKTLSELEKKRRSDFQERNNLDNERIASLEKYTDLNKKNQKLWDQAHAAEEKYGKTSDETYAIYHKITLLNEKIDKAYNEYFAVQKKTEAFEKDPSKLTQDSYLARFDEITTNPKAMDSYRQALEGLRAQGANWRKSHASEISRLGEIEGKLSELEAEAARTASGEPIGRMSERILERRKLAAERDSIVNGMIGSVRAKGNNPIVVNHEKKGDYDPDWDSKPDTYTSAKRSFDDAVDTMGRMVSTNPLYNSVSARIEPKWFRASGGETITMPGNTGTISLTDFSHEFGHFMEDKDPFLQSLANEFLDRRTRGETPKPLKDITGNSSYEDWEVSKPDSFFSPYIGKVYGSWGTIGKTRKSTEVISMGLESMAGFHPEYTSKILQDPDYFDFMYAIIHIGE